MDVNFDSSNSEDGTRTPTSYLVFRSAVPTENLQPTRSASAGSCQSRSHHEGIGKGILTGSQSPNRPQPPTNEHGGTQPRKSPEPDLRSNEQLTAAASDFLSRHPEMASSFRRALAFSAMLEAQAAAAAPPPPPRRYGAASPRSPVTPRNPAVTPRDPAMTPRPE